MRIIAESIQCIESNYERYGEDQLVEWAELLKKDEGLYCKNRPRYHIEAEGHDRSISFNKGNRVAHKHNGCIAFGMDPEKDFVVLGVSQVGMRLLSDDGEYIVYFSTERPCEQKGVERSCSNGQVFTFPWDNAILYRREGLLRCGINNKRNFVVMRVDSYDDFIISGDDRVECKIRLLSVGDLLTSIG